MLCNCLDWLMPCEATIVVGVIKWAVVVLAALDFCFLV